MDADEKKASKLVTEMQLLGHRARLWWDRGPYCCQVFLTEDDSEYAPSLLLSVEDEDSYKLFDRTGAQFGWRWRGSLVGFEDHHLLAGIEQGVAFEFLERRDVSIAGDVAKLVLLLSAGTRELEEATV